MNLHYKATLLLLFFSISLLTAVRTALFPKRKKQALISQKTDTRTGVETEHYLLTQGVRTVYVWTSG